jgi:SAM-dependent methyltransferase
MSGQTFEDIREAWRQSAAYWEKHRETIQSMFQPITAALIAAARIRPENRILDVAGGPGEPSLTIARDLANSGSIVCTDLAGEMVAAAARENKKLGLKNVYFCQCSAQSLPFLDCLFDAAISRLGAMFFPDPVSAACQMLRTVRPGGKIVLAVWGERSFNPFFGVVTDIMSRYVEAAPEDPDAPGAFRFAEPGKLLSIVKQSGAIRTGEEVLDFRIESDLSASQFWPLRVEMSDTLREKTSRFTVQQLAAIETEITSAVAGFFKNGRMSFPARVIIVTGTRP